VWLVALVEGFFGEVLAEAIEAAKIIPAARIGNFRWTKLIRYISASIICERPWYLANCLHP
jgi:hypothetical protein